jgi:double-stranded uracil-DNA glycosylase
VAAPRPEPPRALPELVAPGLRLLFVGYNPSLRSAELGHYYAGRGNRLWDLLASSGLTPRPLRPVDDRALLALGIGVTDLVGRPSRAAADVTAAEYRAGSARLRRLLARFRPRVVAYSGKGVYLRAARVPRAPWGRQDGCLVEGCVDFVVPSPSGLARLPFAEKAAWYTRLRQTVEETDR